MVYGLRFEENGTPETYMAHAHDPIAQLRPAQQRRRWSEAKVKAESIYTEVYRDIDKTRQRVGSAGSTCMLEWTKLTRRDEERAKLRPMRSCLDTSPLRARTKMKKLPITAYLCVLCGYFPA